MAELLRKGCHPRGEWQIIRCSLIFAPPRPFSLRRLWRGLQQSFRLMVGVQDYQRYLQHWRQHHPDQPPMSERDFHRYCLEARFPSQAGKVGKCPC